MKKLIFVITLLLGFGLVSCGEEKPKKPNPNLPQKTNVLLDDTEKETPEPTISTEEETLVADPLPPEQIKEAKAILASVSASDVAAVEAKNKYKMFCAACHGFDGKLKINGAKDLSKSRIPMEERVAQIYFGKGLMTPWKGILKNEEIVAVSQYLDELRK